MPRSSHQAWRDDMRRSRDVRSHVAAVPTNSRGVDGRSHARDAIARSAPPPDTAANDCRRRAKALSGAPAAPNAPWQAMTWRLSSSTRARLTVGEARGRVARRQRARRIEEVGIKIGAGSSLTDARAAGPRRAVDDLHAFS